MNTPTNDDLLTRLNSYFLPSCNWDLFYSPKTERKNFATRYHLVYPALVYYVKIFKNRNLKSQFKPVLDSIYSGLKEERVWNYWHTEIKQDTQIFEQGNLTYVGRFATFLALYYETYQHFPEEHIDIDGKIMNYVTISQNLVKQMNQSSCGGVTCFENKAMVPCNSHLLINNIFHDRIYDTDYSTLNEQWLLTLETQLLSDNETLFYYGTKPNSCHPRETSKSLGMDAWSLFLFCGLYPKKSQEWFDTWKRNITFEQEMAWINIPSSEEVEERSSTLLASAWLYCITRELGELELADKVRRFLMAKQESWNDLNPLILGLVVLGENLEKGDFNRLIFKNVNRSI